MVVNFVHIFADNYDFPVCVSWKGNESRNSQKIEMEAEPADCGWQWCEWWSIYPEKVTYFIETKTSICNIHVNKSTAIFNLFSPSQNDALISYYECQLFIEAK